MLLTSCKLWTLLLLSTLTSALPLTGDSDATNSQLVNLARSNIESSGYQLLPRGGEPETRLYSKEEPDKRIGGFRFIIEATNWKPEWFKGTTAEQRASAIKSKLKDYLKFENAAPKYKPGWTGGNGSRSNKMTLALSFPDLREERELKKMQGYLTTVLEKGTKRTEVKEGPSSSA